MTELDKVICHLCIPTTLSVRKSIFHPSPKSPIRQDPAWIDQVLLANINFPCSYWDSKPA